MNNPFKPIKKRTEGSEENERLSSENPLSVEDLLVDGTMKATVTSDGRLISKKDAVKNDEDGIDLLKQREWGCHL